MQRTLKAERKRRQWTLEELAKKSGVNKATISRLERGETSPMLGTALALEKAFGIKRGELAFSTQPDSIAS